MMSANWIVQKRHYVYIMSLLLAGGLLFGNSGLQEQSVSAQAANSMYLSPASGSYAVGSTITVSIRENSASGINVAQAELKYTPNLEFVAIDGAGSAFSIDASSVGGNGAVTVSRGTTGSVNGDQLVSKVSFRVIAAGTATIEVQEGSEIVSADDSRGMLSTRTGSSYTLQASGGPTPATPPATPAPGAPGAAVVTPASRSFSLPAVTIATQGSSQATPLPGDSIVELQAPVTIETATDTNRPVKRVEYSLNGKVVSTDTTPPYSFSIDTTNMRNGSYTLLTKTYYQDGKTDSSESSLVVKNAFGIKQFWLQLRHFAWLVIILIVIAGELIYLRFFRGRKQWQPPVKPGDGSTPANTSGHGSVVVGGGSSY